MHGEYAQFQARNAEIVALVVESQPNVETLVARFRYFFPVLADPDHVASSAYGVYNLFDDGWAAPSVFIVDEGGLVTWDAAIRGRSVKNNDVTARKRRLERRAFP